MVGGAIYDEEDQDVGSIGDATTEHDSDRTETADEEEGNTGGANVVVKKESPISSMLRKNLERDGNSIGSKSTILEEEDDTLRKEAEDLHFLKCLLSRRNRYLKLADAQGVLAATVLFGDRIYKVEADYYLECVFFCILNDKQVVSIWKQMGQGKRYSCWLRMV